MVSTRLRRGILLCAALVLTSSHSHAAPRGLLQYDGSIILSVLGDPTRTGGFKRLIAAYNQYQPNVRVKVELKAGGFGNVGGYDTWLNTQLASGNPRPDIVSGNYSQTYDSYVNFDFYRYCLNPYTGHRWEEDLSFDFAVFRNSMGLRMMLPTQAVHIQWFYNKDMFEALGLSAPKTWAEFMDTCANVKASGKTPVTLRFDFRFHQWLLEILWDQYSRPNFQQIRALPGDWCFNKQIDGPWKYDPSNPLNDATPTINQGRLYKAIRDGVIRYDTPEFVQCLRNMKEIAQYGPTDFLLPGGDAYSQFLRQEAAMHLDGTWLLPLIDRDMEELRSGNNKTDGSLKPFRWGTFDPPPQQNPLVVAPVRSIESSSGEYVSVIDKNQPQTDMVMDFVMFWLSAPGYQAYLDGQVEGNEFVPTGKIMVRGVTMPPEFERLFSGVNMVGNAEIMTNSLLLLPPAGSRLIQDARQSLVDYVQDKIGVEEAARRIQTTLQSSIAENMERNGLPISTLDHPEINPGQFK